MAPGFRGSRHARDLCPSLPQLKQVITVDLVTGLLASVALQAVNGCYAGDATGRAVTRAEEVRAGGAVAATVVQGIA